MTGAGTIARTTFTDALRRPVFAVLLVLGLLSIALCVPLSLFALGEEQRLLQDLGLSAILTTGLLTAALLAGDALGGVRARLAAASILCAPVGRPAFLLGTYLGIAGATAAAVGVWGAALALALSHGVATDHQTIEPFVLALASGALLIGFGVAAVEHYRVARPFGPTLLVGLAITLPAALLLDATVHDHGAAHHHAGASLSSLASLVLLSAEAIAIVAAVAVAAAQRLGTGGALAMAFLALVLGLGREAWLAPLAARPLTEAPPARADGAELAEKSGEALRSDWIGTALARTACAVVPDLTRFAIGDRLSAPRLTPRHHLALAAYAALAVAAWLAVAAAGFEVADVG